MAIRSSNNGYNSKNIDSIDKKYKCLICRLILGDPVQLTCGHRVCCVCLPKENNIVECPECSEITLISKIKSDKGFNNDMQILRIICLLCDWTGQLKDYQSHIEQTHGQYQCSYCNEIFNSPTLLQQHKEIKCSQVMVNCLLEPYGCKEKILRCNLGKHYLTDRHQQILMGRISKSEVNTSKQNEKLSFSDIDVDQEMVDLQSKATTDQWDGQQEALNETLQILCGGIEALNDDLQRLSSTSLEQSLHVKSIKQRLTTLKTSVEESNNSLDAFNANAMVLQQEFASLKQRIDDMQSTSYDGTLVWKITKIQEKMMDAQSERQVSVYSPPFYSSSTGYKMCARIYLYGDGNARRTHVSLFFVLMRSLNDPLLKFPFSYKVSFCLFDQTGQNRHIVDSFRPDIRSSSFQRPRCDMNIASGIPKFIPLSFIEQSNNPYIKDDTMFIKIMVDFENLPKVILPYVMSLNPGLPIHCQQMMIEQEIKRRTEVQSQQMAQTNMTKNQGTTSGNSTMDDIVIN